MNVKRLKQVLNYGWLHSGQIADKENQGWLYRVRIFFDILYCFIKYKMWSNQYVKEKFHLLEKNDRQIIGEKYREEGIKRDKWQKDFIENRRFLVKYSNIKYEIGSLREKRNKAYTNRFNAGKQLCVEYNVNISRQHYLNGSISIGKNVLLAKNVFIDYSGNVVIEDNVKFSDGAVIESHTHPIFSDPSIPSIVATPTTVIIHDGVCIGSKSIILDSCSSIGRNARIAAGAVVRNKIPPYAVVVGNPAKIVGFVYTPEEMEAYEKIKYSETDRTSVEQYRKLYDKYFLKKIIEIKNYLKN